jgi:hypothetical protein
MTIRSPSGWTETHSSTRRGDAIADSGSDHSRQKSLNLFGASAV